jgi:hypothetical protein
MQQSALLRNVAHLKKEDKQNEELLTLSNQILELTRAIHAFTSPRAETTPTDS